MSVFTPYVPQLISPWEQTSGPVGFTLDGALVFADLSGFTALSERLAKRGRVGAEELTEILDATFARLLGAAYENGGSLLKFGGDALLLFFEGPMHAERAAHAAATMQLRLTELGRLTSSSGSVRLRMSMGAHAGSFTFAVVGETHRELLVCGAGVSTTVGLEHHADGGEILISDALAAALPERILGERRDDGVLLRRSPPAPTQGLSAARRPPVHADRFLSEAIRAHIADGGLSEHRVVTVGFVKFTGTDELAARKGPAHVAEVLHELVGAVQHAALAEGTTFLSSDVEVDGGKFIVVGGAPLTRGDDDERLVRTLLRVRDLRTPLQLRLGAHVGKVFVGGVGPPFRRSFTVMGDAVNLAARLMSSAEPGQLVASPDVPPRLRSQAVTSPLPPFTPKGKSEPIAPVAIAALRGSAAIAQSAALPLIGREDEFAQVMAQVAALIEGAGGCVELVGEPGIGKTRLVDEVQASITALPHPPRTLRVATGQYEGSVPYALGGKLLRALLDLQPDRDDDLVTWTELTDALRRVAPESVEDAGHLADVTGTPVPLNARSNATGETRRQLVHRAVRLLLQRCLAGRGLIALVEDLYWADEPSLALLENVASPTNQLPLLIICTRRAGQRGLAEAVDGQQVHLGPLTDRASEAFIQAATAAAPLAPSQIAVLVQRAGGHPLFLLELSRAGLDPGADLPDSVEAMISARIDTLSSKDRWVLRLSSVLGQSFDKDLLPYLGADPNVSDAERWGNLTSFVEVTSTQVRFHHALYRETAYSALPFRTRRDLHARVAEAIETRTVTPDAQAAVLSLHFHRAHITDKAWHYSMVAAQEARDKYASASAATFLMQAIDAATSSGRSKTAAGRYELCRAWEQLGDAREVTGDLVDAGKAYRSARRLVPGGMLADPALLTKEGRIRDLLGEHTAALRWLAKARHAWLAQPDAEPADLVHILLGEAAVYYRKGDNLKVAEICEEAIAQASRAGLLAELARAYYLIHVALTTAGDPRRRDYRQLALQVYEQLGDLAGKAKVLNNLGVEDYYDGNWVEALKHYRACMAIEERLGLTTEVALSQSNIAELLVEQGQWEESLELASLSLTTCLAARYPVGQCFARAIRGRALLCSPDAARAREGLAELRTAIDGFLETDQLGQAREARLHWARGLADHGETDRAIVELEALHSEVMKQQPESALAAQTKLALANAVRAEQPAAAGALVAESLEVARAAGALHVVAAALSELIDTAPRGTDVAGWLAERDELGSSLGLVPA